MVDLNVNGKNAVVTGGTRGLGLYCAETYVLNGAATVIITSRKEKACEEAQKHLEKLAADSGKHTKVVAIPADLGDEKDTERFFTEASKHIDKLHILVANAGATWGAPLEDHAVSAVRKVLNLNVAGVFQCVQLFAPLLEAAGTAEDPARVIIMSSTASISSLDAAGVYGYTASKAGVSHMGKSLALQLGPRNITVNSLAPGFFPSKMSQGVLDATGSLFADVNPRRRIGVKEDIQAAILFLSAKESNYINGVVLPLDGGAHLSPGAAARL